MHKTSLEIRILIESEAGQQVGKPLVKVQLEAFVAGRHSVGRPLSSAPPRLNTFAAPCSFPAVTTVFARLGPLNVLIR